MTPGYRTTEFWALLASNLGAAFIPALSPEWQAGILAVTTAAYTVSRAAVKRKY